MRRREKRSWRRGVKKVEEKTKYTQSTVEPNTIYAFCMIPYFSRIRQLWLFPDRCLVNRTRCCDWRLFAFEKFVLSMNSFDPCDGNRRGDSGGCQLSFQLECFEIINRFDISFMCQLEMNCLRTQRGIPFSYYYLLNVKCLKTTSTFRQQFGNMLDKTNLWLCTSSLFHGINSSSIEECL